MSTIEIRLLGRSRCRARHVASGAEIETDVAPELGGGGSTFSSTDLLAAALGTCVGSSIAPMLEREGMDPTSARISVGKQLATKPKRIQVLSLDIRLGGPASERQIRKVGAAARSCLVHRNLASDLDLRIEVTAPGTEPGSP